MAHATYPSVYWDEDANLWKCEMRDKKVGRIWGEGYGNTRQEAIYNARNAQPVDHAIKRAIGWATWSPIIGGAAAGTLLLYTKAKKYCVRLRVRDYVTVGAIAGVCGWLVSKVYNGFKNNIMDWR